MPNTDGLEYDSALLVASISTVVVQFVALGIAIKNRWEQDKGSRSRWDERAHNRAGVQKHLHRRRSISASGHASDAQRVGNHLVRNEAGTYPYTSCSASAKSSFQSCATFSRFGKDGRRRLLSIADSWSNENSSHTHPVLPMEEFVASNPTARAMSSRDMLLAVFRYLDRKDTLACGTAAVALHQAATDDTIWMDYVKADTPLFLRMNGMLFGKASPKSLRDLTQAGLGRVIEVVYARLPRAYFDIYPRLPPARDITVSRRARKSWYRLHLTMMRWVPYLAYQRKTPEMSGRLAKWRTVTRTRLALESTSQASMEAYGMTALFPEQILSFVALVYSRCCIDYWDELVQRSMRNLYIEATGKRSAGSTGHDESTLPSVPIWGDMLRMLDGYVRLYKRRMFIVLKDNMGFLLQDPNAAASENAVESSDGDSPPDVQVPQYSSVATTRELRIPCSHKVFIDNLESPAVVLTRWPYTKQLTLEDFVAEFYEVGEITRH